MIIMTSNNKKKIVIKKVVNKYILAEGEIIY